MAISGSTHKPRSTELKLWKLCPFWQSNHTSSSSSSTQHLHNPHGNHNGNLQPADGSASSNSKPTVSAVARALLPAKRRLRLDPPNHLYFPYEPGKQARSAVRIKNTSKSHVAFKFQTTAPKSCYMRPPGGILAPGESLVATVFKFVEQPENNEKLQDLKTKVKFKIMSLKVKEGTEYAPELFDEQKDQATVERILRVIFLDPDRPSSAMEKLKRQLAEADAAVEAQKKPPAANNGPKVVGEGLVIDEWKERREKYLAQQQVEAVEAVV
uniref:MSP domain-containing protein n=1 Tax=Opuntia streptacantha TaxID=393608 RepID=A0A7C9E1Z6_OPUST